MEPVQGLNLNRRYISGIEPEMPVTILVFNCMSFLPGRQLGDDWEPSKNQRCSYVESSWNVMAHGDAREGKWRGNWRMEWVASTFHTTSEHGVSSITTADAHTSAASSRLNWRPCRFKWTRPFRRKTKPCFCTCVITFQTQSTKPLAVTSQKPAIAVITTPKLVTMRQCSFTDTPLS